MSLISFCLFSLILKSHPVASPVEPLDFGKPLPSCCFPPLLIFALRTLLIKALIFGKNNNNKSVCLVTAPVWVSWWDSKGCYIRTGLEIFPNVAFSVAVRHRMLGVPGDCQEMTVCPLPVFQDFMFWRSIMYCMFECLPCSLEMCIACIRYLWEGRFTILVAISVW